MEATPAAQERPRQVWQEERRPALPTALPSSPAAPQPSRQGAQSVPPSEAWWVREPTEARPQRSPAVGSSRRHQLSPGQALPAASSLGVGRGEATVTKCLYRRNHAAGPTETAHPSPGREPHGPPPGAQGSSQGPLAALPQFSPQTPGAHSWAQGLPQGWRQGGLPGAPPSSANKLGLDQRMQSSPRPAGPTVPAL